MTEVLLRKSLLRILAVREQGISGRFSLLDEIRHESKLVLESLNRDGITTMMLTGENVVVVQESSTVLVFLNSLRLLFLKDDEFVVVTGKELSEAKLMREIGLSLDWFSG